MAQRKPTRPQLEVDRASVLDASLRAIYRRAFTVIASGEGFCVDEWARLRDRYLALLDDVGPTRTFEIAQEEAARWRREQGRCPWCAGPIHDEEEP